MTCEYFSRLNGEAFCRIYRKLKSSNQEKILECESNFFDCSEKAKQTLTRRLEDNAFSRFK